MKYEPGELRVVAYRYGKKWAENVVKTTDEPARLQASADRELIRADGKDLAFITLKVTDENGQTVPTAMNPVTFEIDGPGEIVATDNGDPTNFVPFPSHEREAFHGLALAIIRSKAGHSGTMSITAKSPGLEPAQVIVKSQ